MKTLDNLKYTATHEWVRSEPDGTLAVGITDFAQDALGDVVYVDLPEAGAAITQFEKMGEIESVKAVSDLFSPISGDVVATNHNVVENPEVVNSDAHGEGWLIEVRLSDPGELDKLMTAEAYDAFIAEQA